MISRTTKAFRDALAALPLDVQKQADESFALFKQNPSHPGLHFKPMKRRGRTFYSARVGMHYRALALEKPDGLYWFWIGTHGEYDQLIDHL